MVQTLSVAAVSIGVAGLSICYRPFDSFRSNFKAGVTEVGIALITVVVVCLALGNFEANHKIIAGWVIVGLCGGVLGVHYVFIMKELLQSVPQLFRRLTSTIRIIIFRLLRYRQPPAKISKRAHGNFFTTSSSETTQQF